MKRLLGVMLGLSLAMAGTACDKDRSGTSTTITTATKTETKVAGGTRTTEVKTETKTTDTSAGSDLGIAECDEYVKKLADCSTRSAAAAAMMQTMASVRQSWKEGAGTAEGRAAVARSCTEASEAAKTAYASVGCSF